MAMILAVLRSPGWGDHNQVVSVETDIPMTTPIMVRMVTMTTAAVTVATTMATVAAIVATEKNAKKYTLTSRCHVENKENRV